MDRIRVARFERPSASLRSKEAVHRANRGTVSVLETDSPFSYTFVLSTRRKLFARRSCRKCVGKSCEKRVQCSPMTIGPPLRGDRSASRGRHLPRDDSFLFDVLLRCFDSHEPAPRPNGVKRRGFVCHRFDDLPTRTSSLFLIVRDRIDPLDGDLSSSSIPPRRSETDPRLQRFAFAFRFRT